jgi:sulfonate transport system substrate-binding protein
VNTNPFLRRALALLTLPLLALAACGSDGESEVIDTTPTASAAPATDAATPVATDAAPATATDATDATAAPATEPVETAAPIDLSGVTLRVGDQVNLAQSALEAAGLTDTPYTIEWSTFASGPPMLEAMNADAIDLGGVGDAPPIFAASSGAAIKVVLATSTPEVKQGVLVPAGSEITEFSQLAGKTIAVAKGSSANWVLLKALSDNGLTVDDVEVAYLQPADALQAFNSGSVDAWAVWDPYTSLAISQGASFVVTGDEMGIPGWGFQVASDKALADPAKEAAMRDYLGRLRVAQQWQRDNKDAWGAKYSELTGLPADVTQQMLEVDTVPSLMDDKVVESQQAEADAFFAAGLIPAAVDFSTVADARFDDVTVL